MGEERADLAPAMNRAAIPEQVDGSPQVPQEMPEEGLNIQAGEIVGSTPEVEGHSPPLGRHGQAATDRQPIDASPVAWVFQVVARIIVTSNPRILCIICAGLNSILIALIVPGRAWSQRGASRAGSRPSGSDSAGTGSTS